METTMTAGGHFNPGAAAGTPKSHCEKALEPDIQEGKTEAPTEQTKESAPVDNNTPHNFMGGFMGTTAMGGKE